MRGDEPTLLPFLFFLICCAVAAIGANENTYFTNEWIVELDGGKEKADRLAAKYGYVNRGLVGIDRNAIPAFTRISFASDRFPRVFFLVCSSFAPSSIKEIGPLANASSAR